MDMRYGVTETEVQFRGQSVGSERASGNREMKRKITEIRLEQKISGVRFRGSSIY